MKEGELKKEKDKYNEKCKRKQNIAVYIKNTRSFIIYMSDQMSGLFDVE